VSAVACGGRDGASILWEEATLNRLIELEYPLFEMYSVDPVLSQWSRAHLWRLPQRRLKLFRVFKGHMPFGLHKKEWARLKAVLNVVHAKGEYWELWHEDGLSVETSAAVDKAWREAKQLGYDAYKKNSLPKVVIKRRTVATTVEGAEVADATPG